MKIDCGSGPHWNGYNWRCVCGFHTFSDIAARKHAYDADELRAHLASAAWNQTTASRPEPINLHNRERGAA